MDPTDFRLYVLNWSAARKDFDAQLHLLHQTVQQHRHDVIVVYGIPRHHAKKLQSQSDWTKDYFVSKESRSVTEARPRSGAGTMTSATSTSTSTLLSTITVIFSKYPTSTEQWFALDKDAGFAHVVDVAIPLNAWEPSHCPLSLLQEYQLTYDEVSTITIVVATVITPELKTTFCETNVPNSVVFISPMIEKQLRYWKEVTSPDTSTVFLVSSVEG